MSIISFKKDEIVLHIGLHNTGTTWLQEEFFPKLSKKVFSNENLSGFPLEGLPVCYRYYILEGLKKEYYKSKLILCLRNRETWVKSLYGQYVKRGGILTFNHWYNNIFDVGYLDYDKYINDLKKYFDLFVYDYEDFKKNKYHVLRDLCNFIDCDLPNYKDIFINEGWYNNKIKLGLMFNKLVGKTRYIINRL